MATVQQMIDADGNRGLPMPSAEQANISGVRNVSSATAAIAYAVAKQKQGLIDIIPVSEWYLGLTQPALVSV